MTLTFDAPAKLLPPIHPLRIYAPREIRRSEWLCGVSQWLYIGLWVFYCVCLPGVHKWLYVDRWVLHKSNTSKIASKMSCNFRAKLH